MMIRRRHRLKPRQKHQRKFHHKPKLPSFSLVLSLGSLVIIVTAFLVLFRSGILSLKQIDCTLDNQACRQAHQDILDSYLHKNSLLIKPSKITQDLLNVDPSLAQANIRLNFPHILEVDLISQSDTLVLATTTLADDPPVIEILTEPEATPSSHSSIIAAPHPIISRVLSSDTSVDKIITITQRGDIIPTHEDTSQPKIYLTNSPESYSQDLLSKIYYYNHELQQSAISFNKGWVVESDLILSLKNQAFAVFALDSPPRNTIATLQQIRGQATINLDRAIIDLRFKKPVISTY